VPRARAIITATTTVVNGARRHATPTVDPAPAANDLRVSADERRTGATVSAMEFISTPRPTQHQGEQTGQNQDETSGEQRHGEGEHPGQAHTDTELRVHPGFPSAFITTTR
jgi:hypothetical protein